MFERPPGQLLATTTSPFPQNFVVVISWILHRQLCTSVETSMGWEAGTPVLSQQAILNDTTGQQSLWTGDRIVITDMLQPRPQGTPCWRFVSPWEGDMCGCLPTACHVSWWQVWDLHTDVPQKFKSLMCNCLLPANGEGATGSLKKKWKKKN